jgi:ornithine cyclodeaminase/alanine dehydrogenase-like protein (mu-crystallin family)
LATIDILFLSQADVIACAPSLEENREIIEDVFKSHAEGRVVMPTTRLALDSPSEFKGRWDAMPAYIETAFGSTGGIKWLSSYPHNLSNLNLPNVIALIVINDPATGFPLAIMDGTFITGLRTAAAVTVGARFLASKAVKKISIIGNSVQGKTNLAAITQIFPNARLAAYDVIEAVTDEFISVMQPSIGVPIEKSGSFREAVKGSDIVITATRAKNPFFKGKWLEPGMLVVSIGSMPELMPDVIEHVDKIIVDNWEGCKHLGSLRPFAEKKILSGVYAEIGEIVAGQKPGRESEEERILYVPMGMPSEDLAVAHWVYKKALEKGRGNKFALWSG